MRQALKMAEEAERLALPNYQALSLFFNSFHIIEVTKLFGDVPYSKGLQATTGIYALEYDTQEEIYLKVLDDLKSANSALDAAAGEITGDVIYNGDILKWKKLINSYSLRILMSLSLKTSAEFKNRFK